MSGNNSYNITNFCMEFNLQNMQNELFFMPSKQNNKYIINYAYKITLNETTKTKLLNIFVSLFEQRFGKTLSSSNTYEVIDNETIISTLEEI